jgi:hypothetical protein
MKELESKDDDPPYPWPKVAKVSIPNTRRDLIVIGGTWKKKHHHEALKLYM